MEKRGGWKLKEGEGGAGRRAGRMEHEKRPTTHMTS